MLITIKSVIKITIIISIISYTSLEFAVRLIPALISDGLIRNHYDRYASEFYDDVYHEKIFRASYKDDTLGSQSTPGPHPRNQLLSIHPTRGWVTKPHLNRLVDGSRISTNALGHRSANISAADGSRFTILVVGDSFTFGAGVTDGVPWPSLLAGMNTDLNVINLAVAGYGTDQMLITLKEEFDSYRPQMVIAAFISNDLYRSVKNFFSYRKPRFDLEAGKLTVRNTPIPPAEQVLKELESRDAVDLKLSYYFMGYKFALGAYHHNASMLGIIPRKSKIFDLNQEIFRAMNRIANGGNSVFIAVNLPVDREIVYPYSTSPGEDFLSHIGSIYGIETVSLRAKFVAGVGFSRGHYQEKGHRLVAESLYQMIFNHPSWLEWSKKNQTPNDRHASIRDGLKSEWLFSRWPVSSFAT